MFLVGIGRPSFWIDEATSVGTAGRSWHQLLKLMVVTDPTLGPYYLLMKPWMAVSTAEWWVRLPSALAMAGAVALAAAYAARNSRLRVGVFVAVLAALGMSSLSRYAQEARPYALAVLFCVVAVICWHLALKRRSRWAPAGYCAALVGAGLFHLFSLTVIVALVICAWFLDGAQRRRNLLWTIVPAAVAFVVLSPYFLLSYLEAPGTSNPYDASLRSLGMMFSGMFTALGVPAQVSPVSWGLLLMIVAMGCVGFLTNLSRYRSLAIICATWAVVPPVVLLLAHVLADLPTTQPRYWLFAVPAWCIVAALGLDWVWRKSPLVAVLVVAVAVALAIPSQIEIRATNGHTKSSDLRALDAALRVPALAGLPIVVAQPTEYNTLRGYGPDIVATRIRLSDNPDDAGRYLIARHPSQDEITAALADTDAVILVSWEPREMGSWPESLRAAGFADAVVQCWFGTKGAGRQLIVYARSAGTVPSAGEIADQVVSSSADSTVGCAPAGQAQ